MVSEPRDGGLDRGSDLRGRGFELHEIFDNAGAFAPAEGRVFVGAGFDREE